MFTKRLLTGVASYLPGASLLASRAAGGPTSARYCYAVWLRHLIKAREAVPSHDPLVVAELGPGGSLGTGLAALLSGARRYYAFDVAKHANLESDLKILEELASLFGRRAPIPGPDEFPELRPDLERYQFPSHILGMRRLQETLSRERLEQIRSALTDGFEGRRTGQTIAYVSDWSELDAVPTASVDMVFSQAVLEHVDDLEAAYQAMYQWLKPGGLISHEIDFRSHGTATAWNGHWTFRDVIWKAIRGRRGFLLNRQPHSKHIELIESVGFRVLVDMKTKRPSEIDRRQLAPRFRTLRDEDLETSDALIQAVKR
jgi:SAM-dependent methyltransferase